MSIQRTLMASAILSALASLSLSCHAQSAEKILPTVTVTAAPFNNDESSQVLVPAKVLSGSELRNKLGNSIGDTLSHELGVSASSFGAGASRPIIRGLEGPRVKVLQNGMAVSDVSSLSNDHAVAVDVATARQIEILRGPAALLYGSGAIGGLVNVVNDRIPTELVARATGEAEMRIGSVDKERSGSFSTDSASGSIGLHLDGSVRNTSDYRFPGYAVRNNAVSASGRLPSSFTQPRDLGFGASHIADWGHIGASVDSRSDRYGIPTAERSFIDLSQTRIDLDGLIRQPFIAADSLRVKIGATNYKHTEKLEDGTAATDFVNKTLETRWELVHKPLYEWRGIVGMQTEQGKLSALSATTGRANTVPTTKSSSIAAFLIEERDFGSLRANAGARLESVKRRPDASGLSERSFNLASWSIGGAWTFAPGYSFGTTFSVAQRAPAIEELYSNGPHESTATFDIGDPDLKKERSHNIELTLQKTEGKFRWRTNIFENRLSNYVFSRGGGTTVDEEGNEEATGEFIRRFWSQTKAKIRGAEAEASYNLHGEGLSLRAFADTSRGTLENADSLPLQPASRFGVDAGYRQGPWRSGLSLMRALKQDRLATFENFTTPSYTQIDGSLSYTTRISDMNWTWFLVAKNLLNEQIRLSTSLLRNVAPQPGRSLVVGVRTRF